MFKFLPETNKCIDCKIEKRWFILSVNSILSNNIKLTINSLSININNTNLSLIETTKEIVKELNKINTIFLDIKWTGSHIIFYITEEDYLSGKIQNLNITEIDGISFKQLDYNFEIYPFCGLRNQWIWTEFSLSQLSYESKELNKFNAFDLTIEPINGNKDYDELCDLTAQSIFNEIKNKVIYTYGYDEFISLSLNENIIKFAVRKDFYEYFIQDFTWFQTNLEWLSNANLFISPNRILWKEIESAKTNWITITPSGLIDFELEILKINVGGFNTIDKKPFEIIHSIVNRWNYLIKNKPIEEEKDLILKSKHVDIFVKNNKIRFLINADFIPMGGINNELISHAIWNEFFTISLTKWTEDTSLNFDKSEECLANYIRWGIEIPLELTNIFGRGLFIDNYNLLPNDENNLKYHLNFNGGGSYSSDWTPIKILSDKPITNLNIKWYDTLLHDSPINLSNNNYYWEINYNNIYEYYVYPNYLIDEFNLKPDWKTMNPSYDGITYNDNGISWMYGGHYQSDKIWLKSTLTSQNAKGTNFLVNFTHPQFIKEPIKWEWYNNDVKSSISGFVHEFNNEYLNKGLLNFIFTDYLINTSNIWINHSWINPNTINNKYAILASNNLNLVQTNLIFEYQLFDINNNYELFIPEQNNDIICNFLDKCFINNNNKCVNECKNIYLTSKISDDEFENTINKPLDDCTLLENLIQSTNTTNHTLIYPFLDYNIENDDHYPEHIWNINDTCSSLFLTTSNYLTTDGVLTNFWNKPCNYPLSSNENNFCPFIIQNNKKAKNYLIYDKIINEFINLNEINSYFNISLDNKILKLNINSHFWFSNWGSTINKGTNNYPEQYHINNPSVFSLISRNNDNIKNWITQNYIQEGLSNKGCFIDNINDIFLNNYDWLNKCNNDFEYYFAFVTFKKSNKTNFDFDNTKPLNIYNPELIQYLNDIWNETETKIIFNDLFIKQAGSSLLIWIKKDLYNKSFLYNKNYLLNDKDNLLNTKILNFIPYTIRLNSDYYYHWEFTPYLLDKKDEISIELLGEIIKFNYTNDIDFSILIKTHIEKWCWNNGWFSFCKFELIDNNIYFYIDRLVYLYFINTNPQFYQWNKFETKGFYISSPYIHWKTIHSAETEWIELEWLSDGNLKLDLNIFNNNVNLEDYWGIIFNNKNIVHTYNLNISPSILRLIQIHPFENKIKFKINSDFSLFNLQNSDSLFNPSIHYSGTIKINNKEYNNQPYYLKFKNGDLYNQSEIPLSVGVKFNKINTNLKNKFFSLQFDLGGDNKLLIKDIQLENNIKDTINNIIKRVELDFDRENINVYYFNWNKPKLKEGCELNLDGILNLNETIEEFSEEYYFFFEFSPSYLINNKIWNSNRRKPFTYQDEFNINLEVLGINPIYINWTNQYIYTSGRFPSLSNIIHTNFTFNDSLIKEWDVNINNLLNSVIINSNLRGLKYDSALQFKYDANNQINNYLIFFDNIFDKTYLYVNTLNYQQLYNNEINNGTIWIKYSENNIGLDDDNHKEFIKVYSEYYYQVAQNIIIEDIPNWFIDNYPINQNILEPTYITSLESFTNIKNNSNWLNWINIQHNKNNISTIVIYPSIYYNHKGLNIENTWIENNKGLRWYDNQLILKVLRNEKICNNKPITELCIPINNFYKDYNENQFFINIPSKENQIWLVASFTLCSNKEGETITLTGLLNNPVKTGKSPEETCYIINEAIKKEWNLKWIAFHTKNVSNTIFIWQNTLLTKQEGWYIDWLDISIEGNGNISHNRIEFIPDGDQPDLFNSYYLSFHNLYGINEIDCEGKLYLDWLGYEIQWESNPIPILYNALKDKVNEWNYGDWISIIQKEQFIQIRIDNRINWIFERFIKDHSIWLYYNKKETYLNGGNNTHLTGHLNLTKFHGIPNEGKILLEFIPEEYINNNFYLDYKQWKEFDFYNQTNYKNIQYHNLNYNINNILPNNLSLELWTNRNKISIFEDIHEIYWNNKERINEVTIEGGLKWNKRNIEWDKGWISHTKKDFSAHLWIIESNINDIELIDLFILNGVKYNKEEDQILEIRGLKIEKNNLNNFIINMNYFFSITPDYINWKLELVNDNLLRFTTPDFYIKEPIIKTIKRRLNPPEPINSDIIINNTICSVYNSTINNCRIIKINDTLENIINSKNYTNEEKPLIIFDNNQDSPFNEVKLYFSGGVAFPNWTNWSFIDFNITKKTHLKAGSYACLEIRILNSNKEISIKKCLDYTIEGWDKDGIPIANTGYLCPSNKDDETYLNIKFKLDNTNDVSATSLAIAINESSWNNKLIARAHGNWIRLYLHPQYELNWNEQGKKLNIILNSEELNIKNNQLQDWSSEYFDNIHKEYYHQSNLKIKINNNTINNEEGYSSISIDYPLFQLIEGQKYYFNIKIYSSLAKTLEELTEKINQKLAQWGRNHLVYLHYYYGRDYISILISPNYLISKGIKYNNGKLNSLSMNLNLINWSDVGIEFIPDATCCLSLCGKETQCPGCGCDIKIQFNGGWINQLELNEYEWKFNNGVYLIEKSNCFTKEIKDNLNQILDILLKKQCEERFEVCRKVQIGWNKDLFSFFKSYYDTSDWKDWILEEDWILKKESSITFRAKNNDYLDFSYTYINKQENDVSINLESTNFNEGIFNDFFTDDIINDNYTNYHTLGLNNSHPHLSTNKECLIYWINKYYLSEQNNIWIKIILKNTNKEEILLYLDKNKNEFPLAFLERWLYISQNILNNYNIKIKLLDDWVFFYSLNSDISFDVIKKENDKWYLLKEYKQIQTLIPIKENKNNINYLPFKDNRIEMEIINNPYIYSFIINNREFPLKPYSQINKGLKNWYFNNKSLLIEYGIKVLFQTDVVGDVSDNVQKLWFESKEQINLEIVRGYNCGDIWFKVLEIKINLITDALIINIDGTNYRTDFPNEFLSLENKLNIWLDDNKNIFEFNNIKVNIKNNTIKFWKQSHDINWEVNTGLWGSWTWISDSKTINNQFIGNLKLSLYNNDNNNFSLYRFYSGSNIQLENFFYINNNTEWKITKKDVHYLLLEWKLNTHSEHPLIINNDKSKNLIIENYYKIPTYGDSFYDLPVSIKYEWFNNEELNFIYDNSMFILDTEGDNLNLDTTQVFYDGELPLYNTNYLLLNNNYNKLAQWSKNPKKQKLIFNELKKSILYDDKLNNIDLYKVLNVNLGFRSEEGVYKNKLLIKWDWNYEIKFNSTTFGSSNFNQFIFKDNKLEIQNIEYQNWKGELVNDLNLSGLKIGMKIKLWGRIGINKKTIFKNNTYEGVITEIGKQHLYLNNNFINENLKDLVNEFIEIRIEILPINIIELDLWGKSIGENEILNTMLDNMGINIKTDTQKIFKESNIKENGIDWILINEKRKEMFLSADDIWNYTGTYKSLASWINFFNWDELILRENYMYIKPNDYYNGRISTSDIYLNSGQLEYNELYFKDHWYKTYGLNIIYPITDDNGKWIVEGELNDELTKLSLLKDYLVEKTIPINVSNVNLTGQLKVSNNINIQTTYLSMNKNNIIRNFDIVDFKITAYKLITSNNNYNIVIKPFTQNNELNNIDYEIHVITYRQSKNELDEQVLSQIQEQKIKKFDLTNYAFNVNKDIDYLFEINITTWYKNEYPYSIKRNYRLIDILITN